MDRISKQTSWYGDPPPPPQNLEHCVNRLREHDVSAWRKTMSTLTMCQDLQRFPAQEFPGHHSGLAFYRHLLWSLSRHLAAVQSLRAKAHGVCRHSAYRAPLCWSSDPWGLGSMLSSMAPQTNCVTMLPNSMASHCVFATILSRS